VIGHTCIVYRSRVGIAPKILIAYRKAVPVQFEGLATAFVAERSVV
jgi:hypothetical protein